MAAPTRPARTRSSGGRTLILLGVLLALAAGAIVIFVISTSTGASQQTETVVVASQDLQAGAILSTTQSGLDQTSGATYALISTSFTTKTVNVDFAPKDSYVFTDQATLDKYLNNQVLNSTFYAGEILRQNDPRLTTFGAGAPGSLTTNNPGQIKAGDVLAAFTLSTKVAVVAGDHVDMIATVCASGAGAQSGCGVQTTLQDMYVYAVQGNVIYVVVAHQDALTLQYLVTSATNYTLVIRKPGDDTSTSTTTVNQATVISKFHY